MNKSFWDLEQPRGRLLPALLAGLVPVLVALLATGLLLVRPALNGLEQAQDMLAARAGDPAIAQYQALMAAATGDIRTAFWLSFLAALVSLGFGVASAAVVLRR